MNTRLKGFLLSIARITASVVVVSTVMIVSVISANQVYRGVSPEDTLKIYRSLVIASGESDVFPALQIIDNSQINAYSYYDELTETDGIVVFTGLLNEAKSKDEVALVLAHEMAHYTLKHIYSTEDRSKDVIRRMELQADKYGAFIMMKADYDICKGRMFFKQLKDQYGDYANADHPSNAYRYDQLNVNCGE